MKKYTLQIEIEEGSDEFWEEITENGKTGCDEVLEAIKEDLLQWIGIEIKMVKFEDE